MKKYEEKNVMVSIFINFKKRLKIILLIFVCTSLISIVTFIAKDVSITYKYTSIGKFVVNHLDENITEINETTKNSSETDFNLNNGVIEKNFYIGQKLDERSENKFTDSTSLSNATYLEILKSEEIYQMVINELELEYSYKEFSNRLTTSIGEGGEIIYVYFCTDVDYEAEIVVESIIHSLIDYIEGFSKSTEIVVLTYATEQEITTITNSDPSLNFITSMIIGVLVSSAVIFLSTWFDNKLKNPENFMQYVGLRTVGIISKNKSDKIRSHDEINNIRTNLVVGNIAGNIIGFTSFGFSKEVSKTINLLAKSLVDMNKKVLVLDLKFDKKTQEIGLSEYLSNQITLDNLNFKCFDGYDSIPCGAINEDASTLTTSYNLEELIKISRVNYDYVLIENRNMMEFNDTLITSLLCDSTVLLSQCNKNSDKEIITLVEKFSHIDIELLGVIITDFDEKL